MSLLCSTRASCSVLDWLKPKGRKPTKESIRAVAMRVLAAVLSIIFSYLLLLFSVRFAFGNVNSYKPTRFAVYGPNSC